MSFNKITIIGNLGKDPDLRYTPAGDAVCSFTLATNEKKKDRTSGETVDTTTWFKVTLWRYQAENAAKYLAKVSPVYIEGRLKVEEWRDRENNNRYTLDVTATEMQFLASGTRQDRDDYRPAEQTSAPARQPELYTGPPVATPTPQPAAGSPPAALCQKHGQPFPCLLCDDDIPF